MNYQEIEQEIVNKGLTHSRVTPQDIENAICAEYYICGEDVWNSDLVTGPACRAQEDYLACLRPLTICVLILRNGFTVVGESACASPENFDAELGRKIARQKAVDKMWPLLGYALKEGLYAPNG
jgi:hypothetical protein